MSVVQEKKFVMKHVFTDIMNMERSKEYFGSKERHFNVPWEISIFKNDDILSVYLECQHSPRNDDWSIETEIQLKPFKTGAEECPIVNNVYDLGTDCSKSLRSVDFKYIQNYLVDGNLTVECHVKITKLTGILKENLRSFDESMKDFSDVVLIVENEKFYVGKMYLASHSPYFKSLFMGNFGESKQSEITLNDVDPYDFQKFLEVLHGETAIDEDTVFGILHLADMYDSKTATRRCEEFLTKYSKQSLKDKFGMAIKYKMDELRKKCIAEIKTKEDIISVKPQNANEMDPSVWEELLEKSISLM